MLTGMWLMLGHRDADRVSVHHSLHFLCFSRSRYWCHTTVRSWLPSGYPLNAVDGYQN